MAAGAMANFISRVSSFLLAAATLSATNQPLNNQHHQQHHQLQQTQQQHNHHQHHHHHSFHSLNQQQRQRQQQQASVGAQVKQPFQRHQQPPHLLAAPASLAFGLGRLSHQLNQQQAQPAQHLTNRATVNFPDFASSTTSRASSAAIPFATLLGSSSSSSSPSSPSSPISAGAAPLSEAANQSPQLQSTTPTSAAAATQSQALVAYSAPPPAAASSVFDVFEYVMHYKPSTALISPSALTFNTIPIDFGTTSSKQRPRHQQQAAAASLLPVVVSSPSSSSSSSALQSSSSYPQSAPAQPPSSSSPSPQQQQQHRRPQQPQQQALSQQQAQAPLQQQPQHQQQHHHHHHHNQQQQQPLLLLQRQTAGNGSSSSPEIARSSGASEPKDSGAGRGILSRFSLLQQHNNQKRREDVCGRTMQTAQRRIIGGEGARYGEFPYQVHIKIAKHQCGGALIDRQSIVTAAHCVYHFMTRAPVSKLQIVIGAYDIEDEQYQELPPQYFKVNKVKLHPQFRFSASHPDRYDIAILKLDKPVKYTDNVLPVCLPARDLKLESLLGTVTGFGKTDPSLSNRYGTRLLQKVDVPIIENNECERWHRTRGIDLKIFPEMMCAGYEDGLKDACVGDSGGPLVVKTGAGPDGSFRWTLAGITSAGFGCAQSRQPGIYHRVSHTVDWILENLD